MSDPTTTQDQSERDWEQHLRIQLAAEVDKVNKLQEQLAAEKKIKSAEKLILIDEVARNQQLREQLAAEREKVQTLVDALKPFAAHAADIASNRQELVLKDEDFLKAAATLSWDALAGALADRKREKREDYDIEKIGIVTKSIKK